MAAVVGVGVGVSVEAVTAGFGGGGGAKNSCHNIKMLKDRIIKAMSLLVSISFPGWSLRNRIVTTAPKGVATAYAF